ncbi:MAG: hypothetical protein JJT94_02230 [Bernardetiaceae bacterium]|nr:hypothetical protein [Bernardetiaceae bacterium]
MKQKLFFLFLLLCSSFISAVHGQSEQGEEVRKKSPVLFIRPALSPFELCFWETQMIALPPDSHEIFEIAFPAYQYALQVGVALDEKWKFSLGYHRGLTQYNGFATRSNDKMSSGGPRQGRYMQHLSVNAEYAFFSKKLYRGRHFKLVGSAGFMLSGELFNEPESMVLRGESNFYSPPPLSSIILNYDIHSHRLRTLGTSFEVGFGFQFANRKNRETFGINLIYRQGLNRFRQHYFQYIATYSNRDNITHYEVQSFSRGSSLAIRLTCPIYLMRLPSKSK